MRRISMDREWTTSPGLGDRLLSRRSGQLTPSSSLFGSTGMASPAPAGLFISKPELLNGDEAFPMKPVAPGVLCEKDFLHTTNSFDSSDEDAPQPLKSISTFSRLPEDCDASENGLSESGEFDVGDGGVITACSPGQQAEEDIQNLFHFVGCYKPRDVEIGTLLRPFIPSYVPAVGTVDEFIKVPRPDGTPDYLGLKVLDESGPIQSDPAVVSLQLRASSMQSNNRPVEVATIEDPENNPRKVDAWIESMKDLHRSKPFSSVTFSRPMPDIEKLMQDCPMDIDEAIAQLQLPNDGQDVELSTFVDICCSFLGIPVYKSHIESLHCLFTLYLELKKYSKM